MSTASLLLLADGRFPDGSHAHSFGLEAAVEAGRVHDVASLGRYITGRLWTSGRLDAATARLAADSGDADALDVAWCVRTPSAVARETARSLGRSIVRTASHLVPDRPIALGGGGPPVQAVALGLVAAAVGCAPDEAALASAHGMAATLSAAGLRLLSLDPFEVTAVLHDLRPAVAEVVDSTAEVADPDDLPHASTPFAEIDVEHQAVMDGRLFRS